jgi:hypothetical protein
LPFYSSYQVVVWPGRILNIPMIIACYSFDFIAQFLDGLKSDRMISLSHPRVEVFDSRAPRRPSIDSKIYSLRSNYDVSHMHLRYHEDTCSKGCMYYIHAACCIYHRRSSTTTDPPNPNKCLLIARQPQLCSFPGMRRGA